MKNKLFLLVSTLAFVLVSCSSTTTNEEYEKMNLKGHVKTIKEAQYDVDYVGREVINKRLNFYTTYEFDKSGRLLSKTSSGDEGERVREQYELSHDTLYKKLYYSGELQERIECQIINSKGLVTSSFDLRNGVQSSLKTYEYNNQNKTEKIIHWNNDGFIGSIAKYVYDKNGYLVRIVSCNEAGDSIWTFYNYVNDENGRPLKTRVQFAPDGYPRIITKRYNEFGDITYEEFPGWWEWKYKYTYDNHNNWITQIRKDEDDEYQYTEREYIYY